MGKESLSLSIGNMGLMGNFHYQAIIGTPFMLHQLKKYTIKCHSMYI